ncbi:hypothetical protein [Ornithinimicrobium cavernae]|uniref:hypothetical protein n=1 Tax=Ornithinimicrobium cavernae TaxID=2666047 RepID=UPI000D697111|nr:hypothetical protein [Ornithinimicrobium cavernae]
MSGRTWVVWCGPAGPDPELAAALGGRTAAGDTVDVREHRSGSRGLRAVVARLRGAGPAPYADSAAGRSAAGEVHLAVGLAGSDRADLGRAIGVEVVGREEGLALLHQAQRWDAVDRPLRLMAARPERERLKPTELVTALRDLLLPASGADPRLGADPMPLRLARLRTVCRRLVRQNRYLPARDLLEVALPAWDPDPALGLHALAAHAITSLTGRAAPGLVEAGAAALEGADRALATGDLDLCAELVVIGAGLLLHRDLHADSERSPLVDDPEVYLAPFRGSTAMVALAAPRRESHVGQRDQPEVGQELVGRGDEQQVEQGGQEQESEGIQEQGSEGIQEQGSEGIQEQDPTGTLRVVVLPGAYPRFAGPLVAELRRRPDLEVQVVDLIATHAAFRWLSTEPDLVRLRLAGPEEPPPTDASWGFGVDPAQLRAVREADVVVADWADKGAVWASLVVPASTRLVVRAHGMDAFSLWPHVIDWSRVDALVAVSPHQVEILEDVLRHGAVGPAAHPSGQTVPNIVRLPDVADPPARDPHALVLVGWAKRVKDPLWAVEVLAGLLARGGDWRLVLVGDGFSPGGVVTSQDYAAAFARRIEQPDVAAHIHHVPQTDDVAREVARVGFVLSSSIRESFHQGLVEGVLGGAVPVVRDWPFVARRDGARRLYPPEWVVADVPAAVERIWALREEAERADAAAAAQAQVAARFDPEATATALVRVVLGE